MLAEVVYWRTRDGVDATTLRLKKVTGMRRTRYLDWLDAWKLLGFVERERLATV